MASKVLLETNYTFTPSTKTLVINKYIARERLLKIVNTTTHQTMYESSDPGLNFASYAATSASGAIADSTTLVFKFSTAGMLATDRLQITVDEYTEKFTPSEVSTDPVNKLRVSSPQALIDTDFEYGTQVSKWENLATTNLRPYAYTASTPVSVISDIQMTAGSRVVTVTGSGFGFSGSSYGIPLIVQDTLNPIANGTFAIDTSVTPSGTTFAYLARAAATTTGSIFDNNKTQISQGSFYTGAAIGTAPTITFVANKIKVVTTIPHGLAIGNEIHVLGTSATTSGAPNGTWIVAQIESPNTFYFYSSVTPVGTISGGLVYSRPQGAVLHRPFDGGVIFSSNGGSNYEAMTRQTRRYFRYQSGKGIQISSGTILKPNFAIDTLSYATSTNLVTLKTKDQHNLQPGSTIVVAGANESLFNGTFTVYNVTGYNTFTYTPNSSSASNVTATGSYYASITGWYGAANRLGIFDQQNGLFFEFDGQQLYAVRRNSTYQLAGRVSATNGTTTITATSGFPTIFSSQLVIGDYIVIRGVSYRVDAIASDTSLTISPSYRGATTSGAIVSRTVDTKIPQSQWNIDKMDGTGASGYSIDLAKMQMFYIDYSWYGAGFIRWGIRGANGDVTYVHKMQNNNVNQEAYMRSGNLPARYESITQPPKTSLAAAVGATDTTITVSSTAGFPSVGTAVIEGSAFEHFNYTGITPTTFTGVTRAQAGATATMTLALGSNIGTVADATGIQLGQRVISNTANSVFPDGTFVAGINGLTITLSQALTGSVANPSTVFVPMGSTTGQSFALSATAPTAVELAYPTFAPTISHWGTSVIMDGRFDDDKSLLFTYGQTTSTNLGSPTNLTLTGASSSTNIITVPSTVGVVVGQSVAKTAGTGTLNGVTTVTAITSSTTFTVNTAPSVALSGATIVLSGATTKALFSIRIAPSVDNGRASFFGARDLINRMQLVLRTLDIALQGSTSGNLLVTAVLNGIPSTTTPWAALTSPTSSLAQIADYSTTNTTVVNGGEVTGGFFVNSTGSVDLSLVRDLGNAILGGGATSVADYANANIYPDGPDVLTIVVQNLSSTAASVVGRIAWTEAQA